MLSIKNLHSYVDEHHLVKDVSFSLPAGEIHVLMGKNGSGKSSLVNTIAGHPQYRVESGSITLDTEDITNSPADQRAQAGLFLSLQHIPNVPGVNIGNFLRIAYQAKTGKKVNPLKFHARLKKEAEALEIDPAVIKRPLGVGFSGGEKKQLEMLQIAILEPNYLLFDEIDSGLDIDALKKVLTRIEAYAQAGKGILLITHYPTILEYIRPDSVYLMQQGTIVKQGSTELIDQIAAQGFESFDLS